VPLHKRDSGDFGWAAVRFLLTPPDAAQARARLAKHDTI
jgi:hypothetical protein